VENTKKKYFTHLLLLSFCGLISILFLLSDFGKELELKAIDYQFRLRGNHQGSSEIALILIDDVSRKQLGEAPYARDIFATMILGLNKMGAAVIGLDFTFEEPRSPANDSLLANAISDAQNVIAGCYFRELSVGQKNDPFLIAEEDAPVYDKLTESGLKTGHINILIDEHTGEARTIPMYVNYENKIRPSFAFEIFKTYNQLTKSEIKHKENMLQLTPNFRKPVHIPLIRNGEFLINFFGDENAFENRYSFYDISKYCKEILDNNLEKVNTKIFKDKIVIIGSLIEEDLFSTPHSVEFSGVLIHATVLDNLLHHSFLKQCSYGFIFSLIILGGILFLLFSFTKSFLQMTGIILSLLGLLISSFLLFNYSGIIIPLVAPSLFIILTAIILGGHNYVSILKTNQLLNNKNQELNKLVQLFDEKRYLLSGIASYYRLYIFPIIEKERCVFFHWIEKWNVGNRYLNPFHRQFTIPLKIELNIFRKKQYNIEKIWQHYYNYIHSGETGSFVPLTYLKRIGEQIENDFGLKSTLSNLFELTEKRVPLIFIIDNSKIPWFPWHLAYDQIQQKFLCEDFSIGITFALEKEVDAKIRFEEENKVSNLSKEKSALLFYGTWDNHPTKNLKHVHEQIEKLKKIIENQGYSVDTVPEKVNKFLDKLKLTNLNGNNLRLIHYAGHAVNDYLDINEEETLSPGIISGTLNLIFPSRPLVFLNACSSGKLSKNWDKLNHLSTEFLACGASACIVTTFDVYEKTAAMFSNIFYKYFIQNGLEAGEALKSAIRDLGKPDSKNKYNPEYDITRFSYCLFGDPTVRF